MDALLQASMPAIIGGVFLLLSQRYAHRLQNQQKAQAVESPVVQNQVSPVNIKAHRVAVIRDAGIILLLTAAGGVVIAIAMPRADLEAAIPAIALSNAIFSIIGFTISGSRTTGNRWRHLFLVAVVLWLVSFFNVFLVGVDIVMWLLSILFLLMMMGIGGALSYIFNRL